MSEITHNTIFKTKLGQVIIEIALLVFSAILFALTFPNVLNKWGFSPLAFFCIIPLFIVVHKCGWVRVFIYGIFYGYVCYTLFNYWLATFHPLAIIIVPIIYATNFLILVPLLKLADKVLPNYSYILQAGLWLSYEYFRTLGFLGYPYGNLGYSQYLFLPFIQVSSIFGFWFVSLMVIFPSTFIGNALKNGISEFKPFIRRHRLFIYIYAFVFVSVLIFGFFAKKDYSDSPQIKMGLVQHNSDSWKGGTRQYAKNKEKLINLSKEALKEDPDIEMMIWSETCFVPGIDWHKRYRTDPERYRLVKELEEFFLSQDIPYVFGNDDGRLEPNDTGELERVDYNAVLLYEKTLKQTYRKTHLVPFTEHFPYKKIMPGLYQLLKDNDYHWWKKGEEYTVFDAAGIKFSTPICFEDVFGYLNRIFVRNGAQVIVNLTNDSWSGSIPAEMQHLTMAVFRAIENRRSVVRGANSGITCTIEPDGEITSMAEPFTETYLINSVPIYDQKTTLYNRYGDWFPILIIIISLTSLITFTIMQGVKYHRKKCLTKAER